MATTLRIAAAQMNPAMGDLAANMGAMLRARHAAPDADIIATPELSLIGYPPEDLVVEAALAAAAAVAATPSKMNKALCFLTSGTRVSRSAMTPVEVSTWVTVTALY